MASIRSATLTFRRSLRRNSSILAEASRHRSTYARSSFSSSSTMCCKTVYVFGAETTTVYPPGRVYRSWEPSADRHELCEGHTSDRLCSSWVVGRHVLHSLLVRMANRSGRSAEDILANPDLLRNRTLEEVQESLARTPESWRTERLSRGGSKGKGWVLREYSARGDETGRMIRYHPGGGRHGPQPYWRVMNFNVKISNDSGGIKT